MIRAKLRLKPSFEWGSFKREQFVAAVGGAAATGAIMYLQSRFSQLSFGEIRDWVSARFYK